MISLVKIRREAELPNKVGPSMNRHAKLVQDVHQMAYEVLERHGKTISWGNMFVWI